MSEEVSFQNWIDLTMERTNIMVLDADAEALSSFNQLSVVPFFSINICHAGSIDVEYDSKQRHFKAHQIAVLYPNHQLVIENPTPDYRVTIVCVSYSLLDRIALLNMHTKRFVMERSPQFDLSEQQYRALMDAVNTLKHTLSHNPELDDMLSDYALLVVIGMIISFYKEGEGDQKRAKNYLSPRLHKALIENCHIHHDVDFYAEKFCLSPKHFSTVIKQETGMPAGHWIRQMVVLKAKMMLKSEPSASIQEISARLGFDDQTTFSRYFKRETGITPTEYRLQVNAGVD